MARPTQRHGLIETAAVSDRGQVRELNEDAALFEPAETVRARARGVLLVVADGMGGYAAGEVASRLAVHSVRTAYYESDSTSVAEALRNAAAAANAEIWRLAQQQPDKAGMGCTLVAAVIHGGHLVVAHVGDSRAYLIRGASIAQLTNDHSWVGEQLRAGNLTPEQAQRHPERNVITRALGRSANVEVEMMQEQVPVHPGDVVVLCTDGLTSMVSDDELGEIAGRMAPRAAADALVRLANQRGAPDNVTVAVARVPGGRRPVLGVFRRQWVPLLVGGVVLVALGTGLAAAALLRPGAPLAPDPGTPVAPPAVATLGATPTIALVPTPRAAPGAAASVVTSPAPAVSVASPSAVATATPRTARVDAGGAYLRAAARLGPATDPRVNGNDPVRILEEEPKGEDVGGSTLWYRVEDVVSGRGGWLHSSAVVLDQATRTPP